MKDLTNAITSISNVFSLEVKKIPEHVQLKSDLKELKDVQLEDQYVIIIMLFTLVYVMYFM